METLNLEIGANAGNVYRYLEQNGETSLAELKKQLDISEAELNMALGWLARESKADVFLQGKKKLIKLI